jgi:DNA-binding transcriptional regulator/RsmH inhibitor MraZ
MLIPGYLRDYASLDGEVLIAGMETFLELWQPDNWRTTLNDVSHVLSEAESLLKIGI